MNRTQRIRIIWLYLLFSILGSITLAYAQNGSSWRIKNRLQTSYEYDDNIRESPSSDSLKTIEDSSYKISFHSRASLKKNKFLVRLNYQGGLQNYVNNSFENKLINDISGYGLYSFNRFQFGVDLTGRLKIYLNDVLDYASGSVEGFIVLPRLWGLTNKFSLKTGSLDYKDFSLFNYRTNGLSLAVSRKIFQKLSLQFTFSGEKVNYDRGAINSNFDYLRDTNSGLIKQEDKSLSLQMNVNYTRKLLINLSYMFKIDDSNSYGYSYKKHQLILILGFPVAKTFWLRGYGAVQLKKYDDETYPVFYTDVDTEREESNFFIADLSKDLSPNLSVLVRLTYYNNESTIQTLFYNKLLLTAGFDFRF